MKYLIILSLILNSLIAYDTRSNEEFLIDRYNVVKKRVNEDMYQNNQAYINGKQDSYYHYTNNNNRYFSITSIDKYNKEISLNGIFSNPKGLEASILYYLYKNIGIGLNLTYTENDSDILIGPKFSYNIPLNEDFSAKINLKFLYDNKIKTGASVDFNHFLTRKISLFIKLGFLKEKQDYNKNIGLGVSYYIGDVF